MNPWQPLHSEGVGRWFRVSLQGTIALSVLFSVVSLGERFLGTGETLSALVALVLLLVVLTMSVSFLIWAYKVHRDFQSLFPEYPISPGGALARVLIPVYNLWGYWNLWKTAAGYLPVKPGGRAIDEVLPWFYGSFLVARALGRAIVTFPESLWLDLLSSAADLVMYVTLFMLYEATTYGLQRVREGASAASPRA